jgi:hypothetical protein
MLSEESTPMFLKLSHKIERKGTLPNSFHEVSVKFRRWQLEGGSRKCAS